MTTTLPARAGRRMAPPPTLPDTVVLTGTAQGRLTAHATADCQVVRSASPAPAWYARQIDAAWCDQPTCWPGRRCVNCAAPSGDGSECATCTELGHESEQLRETTGWDVAA